MKTNFDRRKSLQELENDDWGEPDFDSSLVITCHRLRRIPLEDFSTNDLRIMIGQQISLFFLIPLALEELEENPLVDALCYPGDFLNAVLGIPDSFWNLHTDKRDALHQIITRLNETLISLEEVDTERIQNILANKPGSLTDL